MLQRAENLNIRFNRSKCQFGLTEIKFMGQMFSKNGMSLDKSRLDAICDMPYPEDKKALQRFLGMITYLGNYLPNLSVETEGLRSLLKKDTHWQWNANHKKAFDRLKEIITQTPVLAHFDVNLPTVLQVDASKSAVGAALLQNGRPVAYASKTLTRCQQNYAQIEKELYAVVFGCVRFRQYIYGQDVVVETDHSLLVTISKRPLVAVPARLQRMLLQLQTYSLEVVYRPGKYMYIADTLSRAPLSQTDRLLDEEISIHVNLITSSLAVSPKTMEDIYKESLLDETLVTLKKYSREGWPKSKNLVKNIAKPYWNIRGEISVLNDIVYRNMSVIIPEKIRKDILKKIHEGHMGVERTKNLVRGVLFWPQMSLEIKHMIENCSVCLKFRPNNADEPLIPHKVPTMPWEKVGCDFMDFKSKKYLVMVDYYSKFIEIAMLNSNTAVNVIAHCKAIFSRYGIPTQLITDGGPPFSSKEFANFVCAWDIEHVKSSPHYPKSKGIAESAVKIIKNLLKKSDEANTDPHMALLLQRNTPKNDTASPAELLMSRRLRCNFPVNKKILEPNVNSHRKHVRFSEEKQIKYKKYHDRGCRSLPELRVGDKVCYKLMPNGYWLPATVKSCNLATRSYVIRTADGVEYRRNRKHLLKVNVSRTWDVGVEKKTDTQETKSSPRRKESLSLQRD